VPGITDIVFDLYPTSATVTTSKKNLRVNDGQRAIIVDKASDIQVVFTGAPVYFDIRIGTRLKGAHSRAEADLEIRERLVGWFGGSPTRIDADGLAALLQPSDLHQLSAADLHWTIEYDQAGLIVRERDDVVEIAEQERAVLRKVTVEVHD